MKLERQVMHEAGQETKAIESQCNISVIGKLLFTFLTDILFSILVLLIPFCICLAFDSFKKDLNEILGAGWKHGILLLISLGLICGLIFAIQCSSDFLKSIKLFLKK